MKEFNKESMINATTIITNEMFDRSDFQSFIKKEFKWLINNDIKAFVHKSVVNTTKTPGGVRTIVALRDFAGALVQFGPESKERYANDLLQKIITASRTNPVIIITTNRSVYNNANIINSIDLFSKNNIEVVLFDNVQLVTEEKVENTNELEDIRSLFIYK